VFCEKKGIDYWQGCLFKREDKSAKAENPRKEGSGTARRTKIAQKRDCNIRTGGREWGQRARGGFRRWCGRAGPFPRGTTILSWGPAEKNITPQTNRGGGPDWFT